MTRKNLLTIFSIISLISLSISSWIYYYFQGLTIVYNDSMSHLNMARLVVDNINPGFAQLGGVWLPLPHIFTLLLVWNNTAWHTGLAASFFSLISYTLSIIGIYLIIKKITFDKAAAFIGAAAFASNLNILYIQTTPLTEMMYICFFVFSILSYLLYVKNDNPKFLLLLGILGFLQVLTRYDGWFVVVFEGLLVIAYEWLLRRHSLKEVIGKTMIFAFPVAFGIGLWFIWNLLIFKDLFFFATGAYSAHAQQAAISEKSELATKGNILVSVLTYWYTSLDNVGILTTLTGFIGLIYYLISKKLTNFYVKFLIILLIITPILFNVLSLYLGFSTISIPELSRSTDELSKHWFNVRYGTLALPFFTIFTGILSSWKKPLKPILVILIVLQIYLMSTQQLITVLDGTIGTSAFVNQDVSQVLAENVESKDKVLLSMAYFNAVAFSSNKNLQQFIHEGSGDIWTKSLKDPQDYAEWVVVSRGDTGDVIYTNTQKKSEAQFSRFFKLFYTGAHANIFKRRTISEQPIYQEGTTLKRGSSSFKVVGVNAYNLAFQSDEEIRANFEQFNHSGINTVRFWLFNNGTKDGLQPKSGIFNEQSFQKTDLIFSLANQHNIKLIPVLANYGTEYGGASQYLNWVGKIKSNPDTFYVNTDTKYLYKNYLNYVLSRHNTITGNIYAEDNAILAWDLINEPQASDLSTLQLWTKEMASYVREKDNTHLVMVGSDSATMCSMNIIDICSVHVHIYGKDTSAIEDYSELKKSISQQQNLNENLRKPIIWELDLEKSSTDAEKQNYNNRLIWN